MRLLLGVGACGNYLAGVKVIGQWLPPEDRGLAACCFNGGSLAGAILAPPLVTFLMLHYGWQSAFVLRAWPGCCGCCFGRRRTGSRGATRPYREMLARPPWSSATRSAARD
jgi:MFS family permease